MTAHVSKSQKSHKSQSLYSIIDVFIKSLQTGKTHTMKSIKQSLVTLFFVSVSFGALAQGKSVPVETPKNYHLLDRGETGYYGISLDKAYSLLKGKKSKTVVVAVIDSGVDTLHEDLKPVLWHNPKEIPGNGKDDDGNG